MKERKAAREYQLLEAASCLFREKGYHNTSMQDLADALGVQKGSLYYYIESKEELLRLLLERAASLLGSRIDEIYAADIPAAEKLRRTLEYHAKTIMNHLNPISVYLHEYRNLAPERLEKVLAVRKHYERVLMRILEDGVAPSTSRWPCSACWGCSIGPTSGFRRMVSSHLGRSPNCWWAWLSAGWWIAQRSEENTAKSDYRPLRAAPSTWGEL